MSKFPPSIIWDKIRLIFASTFVIEAEDSGIPSPLISFIRLLLLPQKDWEKAKEKQKLPKPKLNEEDGSIVLDVISQGLQQRLDEFPSPIEVFESGLSSSDVRLTCILHRLTGNFFPSRICH